MKEFIRRIKIQLEGYDFFDTFKHSSTYFSAIVLINILGLISLPVYTSFLDDADFGIVEVFNNTVKLLMVLLTFNTHQAVSRYYFEEKEDWRDFLGTSFITSFSVFILTSSLLFIYRDSICFYWNIPYELFYWIFPATICLIILSVFNQLFIAKKEPFLVAKGQILFSYLRFLGAIIFLYCLVPNYFGRIVGDIIFMVVVAIYLLYKIYPFIKWRFKKAHLSYIFNFTLPLIPFSISAFILNYFDLFMINFSSNSDAGLYSFAYKIGFLFVGLDQALQNAGKPDFFKWMNSKNYTAITGQVKSIMKVEVLGAAFLILFAYDLGFLLASKKIFTTSLDLVPIIVMSYVFFSAYNFYGRLLLFSKKTIYISLITILAGVFNIVLNSIYIPKFGYEAAAYTTLISYALMFLMGWLVIVKVMKMPPPPLGDILLKITVVGMILIINYLLNQAELAYALTFLFKILIFGSLFLGLFKDKVFGLLKG